MPEGGLREMCAWERFCAFAREPERRRVGSDARITIEGVTYEVDADLAGEEVILWWGLFDRDLYVEHGERRYGPLATNDFRDGAYRVHRDVAIHCREIVPDPAGWTTAMRFDVDCACPGKPHAKSGVCPSAATSWIWISNPNVPRPGSQDGRRPLNAECPGYRS